MGHERRAQFIRYAGTPQQREAFRHACRIRIAKRRVSFERRFIIHGHIIEEPVRNERAEHLRAASVGVKLRFVAQRAHAADPFRQVALQRRLSAGEHHAIEEPGPLLQKSKNLCLGKKRRFAQNVPVMAIEATVVAACGKKYRRKAAGEIHRAEFF